MSSNFKHWKSSENCSFGVSHKVWLTERAQVRKARTHAIYHLAWECIKPALVNTDAHFPGWDITSFFFQLQKSCFSSCITMGKGEKEDRRVLLPGASCTLEYGCRERIQDWPIAHRLAQWSAVSNTYRSSTQLLFMWHKRSAPTKHTKISQC